MFFFLVNIVLCLKFGWEICKNLQIPGQMECNKPVNLIMNSSVVTILHKLFISESFGNHEPIQNYWTFRISGCGQSWTIDTVGSILLSFSAPPFSHLLELFFI